MSGTNSSQGGLTRRSFLKTTAAVAGATALAGGTSLAALADGEGKGGVGDAVFHCVCRPNCAGYCCFDTHVRDGRVVQTTVHQFEDRPEFSRGCLRGMSHVQRIYDPERIKYPMKRVGERGSGEFERISWDDAIDMVVENFKRIQAEYGNQALAFWKGSGNLSTLNGSMPGLWGRLENVLDATTINNSVDKSLIIGVQRVCGPYGDTVGNEAADFVNAKTIVTWGANLTEAHLQSWHFMSEAVANGTKLIVIDPTFTQLAAKADRWIPIRPGTDTVLCFALMHVILDEGLQNDDFLRNHTVAPFLVNPDTGKFVRASDLGVAPAEVIGEDGQTTVVDPYAVLDENGVAQSFELVREPLLSGSFVLEGVTCRTAFDLLVDEIAKFPPSVASEMTEIPEETIIDLALTCADGPVLHRAGYGSQAYLNGVHAIHAGVTLCALTGNIGYPGAGFGCNWNYSLGINWRAKATFGVSTRPNIPNLEFREIMRTGRFQGKDYPIKALVFYCSNALSCAPHSNELINDVVGNLDFVLTVDNVFTDTAIYSDLVLPCAHWFEQEDVVACGESHYMEYSEKAIDPLYESKPDGEIVRMIGRAMGHEDAFAESDEDFFKLVLDTEYHKELGITFEELKKKKAMRYFKYPFIAWEGNTFTTESGRMEFYVENPQPNGVIDNESQLHPELEHLPRWMEPSEAWPENELFEKYPFILMSERPRYRVHSQWFNVKWLRELDPEPTVKINPVDAVARGIEDGEYVECFNDRGNCVAKAVFSNAIRPGTLVYPKNWQMSQHKVGSWSSLVTSDYEVYGMNSIFMDNLCDIRIWKDGE